jgi:integrase/recombinase XerD
MPRNSKPVSASLIANTGNVSKDIVRHYIQYLRLERSYSDNTLDAYCKDLQKLFNYYSDNAIDFRQVTLEELDQFAGSLRERGISARSVARILSGVRSFYRFLLLEKELEQDPTELLESPKIARHLPQVLTVEEIDRILSVIDLSKPEGVRDHCIIEVLYSCGLRISELINLPISNLFLDEGYIRVHGKGSKERLVPISPKAINELRIWLDIRKHFKLQAGNEDYVFVSRARGKKLSRISLFVFIREYAKSAGITKDISPHTFRHSFATHLIQGGANLRAVQDMLGHEDLGTTEIYMHVDVTHLREEILTCHPMALKKFQRKT